MHLLPVVPGTGKAVNPAYESVARASVILEGIKSFRELGSRCTGPGSRSLCRTGDRHWRLAS